MNGAAINVTRQGITVAAFIVVLLLTTLTVAAISSWRLQREVHEWRIQQAETDAKIIEWKTREVCVLWMSGEQRARVRGGGQEDGDLPTWNELCAWMEGITP